MGDTAYIMHPEYCDLCKSQGLQVQAVYDGKTVHGPWAYMCEEHFGAMGVGLGTGRGQRLIVGTKPSAGSGITEVDDEDADDETIASSEGELSEDGAVDSEVTTAGEASHELTIEELAGKSESVRMKAAEEATPETFPGPEKIEEDEEEPITPQKLDWGNLYP